MKKDTQTFAQLIETFAYRYDQRRVFDDFLTMSLCAVTRKVGTGNERTKDHIGKKCNSTHRQTPTTDFILTSSKGL